MTQGPGEGKGNAALSFSIYMKRSDHTEIRRMLKTSNAKPEILHQAWSLIYPEPIHPNGKPLKRSQIYPSIHLLPLTPALSPYPTSSADKYTTYYIISKNKRTKRAYLHQPQSPRTRPKQGPFPKPSPIDRKTNSQKSHTSTQTPASRR